MIYTNSFIKVVDNSGGLIFYCIKIYGKKKISSPGVCGDVILGSLKTVSLKKNKVKSNTMYKAIIVRTKKNYKNIDGISINFLDSGVVLLNNKLQPIGNRIFGAIPKIISKSGYIKILSLAYATF